MALPTVGNGERVLIRSKKRTTQALRGFTDLSSVDVPPFGWYSLTPSQWVDAVIDTAVTAGDLQYVIRRIP